MALEKRSTFSENQKTASAKCYFFIMLHVIGLYSGFTFILESNILSSSLLFKEATQHEVYSSWAIVSHSMLI